MTKISKINLMNNSQILLSSFSFLIWDYCSNVADRLVCLQVKTSAPRAADPGSIPALPVRIFPGRVIQVTLISVLQWLSCEAPADIRSKLRLAGPVSAIDDWVRQLA